MKKTLCFILALAMMLCLITPAMAASGTVTIGAATTITYTESDLIAGASNYNGVAIPVTIPSSGMLKLDLTAVRTDKSISMDLFADAGMTTQLAYGTSLSGAGATANKNWYFDTPGTYYIGFHSYNYGYAAMTCALNCTTGFYTSADTKLENNVSKTLSTKTGDTYLKLKAASTGYITVSTKSYYGDITLCSSTKKKISDATYLSYSSDAYKKAVFGVKKGKTYYIKVEGSGSTTYQRLYDIKYKNTAVSDKSGASKSEAKSMKAKSTYKGVIIANSSTTDWYKIKLTKKTNFRITFKGNANDYLRVRIYNSKGKLVSGGDIKHYRGSATRYLDTNKKFAKGTYYVKISGSKLHTSGQYSISWKTRK